DVGVLRHHARCMWSADCTLFGFFFNVSTTTEIYTLSLHDALPICIVRLGRSEDGALLARRDIRLERHPDAAGGQPGAARSLLMPDRKSTRLNSSHVEISYAVFCLKKKKTIVATQTSREASEMTRHK